MRELMRGTSRTSRQEERLLVAHDLLPLKMLRVDMQADLGPFWTVQRY
jgi:hypothetical protein